MKDNEYLVKMSDYTYLEMKYNQALKDYDEATTRIDKTIVYIDNCLPCIHDEEILEDILEILKGDSNE